MKSFEDKIEIVQVLFICFPSYENVIDVDRDSCDFMEKFLHGLLEYGRYRSNAKW